MSRAYFLNGLQFKDFFSFDYQVGSKPFINFITLKLDGDTDLANDVQALPLQTTSQYHLINNFKQSRSQRSMQMDAFINNHFSDIVFSHPWCLSALVRVFFFLEQFREVPPLLSRLGKRGYSVQEEPSSYGIDPDFDSDFDPDFDSDFDPDFDPDEMESQPDAALNADKPRE